VFSQDPTVCRYIALAGRSCDLPWCEEVCQRPPMSSCRTTSGSETGSANQPSTCVDIGLENAP